METCGRIQNIYGKYDWVIKLGEAGQQEAGGTADPDNGGGTWAVYSDKTSLEGCQKSLCQQSVVEEKLPQIVEGK